MAGDTLKTFAAEGWSSVVLGIALHFGNNAHESSTIERTQRKQCELRNKADCGATVQALSH